MHLEFTFDLHFLHEKKILARIKKCGLLSIGFAVEPHKQEEIVQVEHSLDHDIVQGLLARILREVHHRVLRILTSLRQLFAVKELYFTHLI